MDYLFTNDDDEFIQSFDDSSRCLINFTGGQNENYSLWCKVVDNVCAFYGESLQNDVKCIYTEYIRSFSRMIYFNKDLGVVLCHAALYIALLERDRAPPIKTFLSQASPKIKCSFQKCLMRMLILRYFSISTFLRYAPTGTPNSKVTPQLTLSEGDTSFLENLFEASGNYLEDEEYEKECILEIKDNVSPFEGAGPPEMMVGHNLKPQDEIITVESDYPESLHWNKLLGLGDSLHPPPPPSPLPRDSLSKSSSTLEIAKLLGIDDEEEDNVGFENNGKKRKINVDFDFEIFDSGNSFNAMSIQNAESQRSSYTLSRSHNKFFSSRKKSKFGPFSTSTKSKIERKLPRLKLAGFWTQFQGGLDFLLDNTSLHAMPAALRTRFSNGCLDAWSRMDNSSSNATSVMHYILGRHSHHIKLLKDNIKTAKSRQDAISDVGLFSISNQKLPSTILHGVEDLKTSAFTEFSLEDEKILRDSHQTSSDNSTADELEDCLYCKLKLIRSNICLSLISYALRRLDIQLIKESCGSIAQNIMSNKNQNSVKNWSIELWEQEASHTLQLHVAGKYEGRETLRELLTLRVWAVSFARNSLRYPHSEQNFDAICISRPISASDSSKGKKRLRWDK